MTIFQDYRTHRFGSEKGLTTEQVRALVTAFLSAEQQTEGVLNGRGRLPVMVLPGVGPVVVKPYLRGGMLRHINRRTYLGPGIPRSQVEFERLQFVRRIGVNAPEPLAFAVKGRVLYHAWLITQQLPDVRSLADISRSSAKEAAAYLPQVAEQIRRLIDHRLHHVDLHPGNVLIDSRHKVFLIDFDKARFTGMAPERLARLYRRRWHRAVLKYDLGKELNEGLDFRSR